MGQAVLSDFNALFGAQRVGSASATAGGAGDATKITGQTHDVIDFRSVVLLVALTAVLAQDETITIAAEVQESDDGTNWDTAVALLAATVQATGGAGGSTEHAMVRIADNVEGRKRYVRYNITPDMSAADTDTAYLQSVLILGGGVHLPAAV